MPTIVLGQDEVDCFAAWVSAEAGLPEQADIGPDIKVLLDSRPFRFSISMLMSSFIFADKLWQPLAASAFGALVAHTHAFNGRRGYQRQWVFPSAEAYASHIQVRIGYTRFSLSPLQSPQFTISSFLCAVKSVAEQFAVYWFVTRLATMKVPCCMRPCHRGSRKLSSKRPFRNFWKFHSIFYHIRKWLNKIEWKR